MTERCPILLLDGGESQLPAALSELPVVTAETLPSSSVVIARGAASLRTLTGAGHGPVRRLRQALLVLEPVKDRALLRVAERMFSRTLTASAELTMLRLDELVEVLRAPNRDELFIGGVVNVESRELLLYRGDLDLLVFPLERLRQAPGGPTPDLARFAVLDYGQTIALGDYEAAADAILYDTDPKYRRAAKKRQLQQDASFGASLRRLRLLRGLSRADFPGVSDKELARIERGEVERPHASTLQIIAERLGVEPDALASY